MTGAKKRAAPGALATLPSVTEAQLAAARFAALSPDNRGAAVLGPGDRLLGATGDAERWAEAAPELLRAGDAACAVRTSYAHIATEEGEVYSVRAGELAMVAVTDRFTLASLVLADMRSVLRELERGLAQRPAPARPSATQRPQRRAA